MKTNKQTIEIRRSIVLFFMSITFCIMQSCSTEEALMQNETTIKTVSKQEAIQFLQNSNGLNGNKSKSTNVPLVYDFEKITQEKTSHKEALITVIPAQSDIKDKKTRVILWKVDNTIESIVYNEYASESSTINSFTGIIIMKRLNGDFIRAYKLKNNNYVIDLLPIKKDATSKSSNSFGEEPFGLHEVIVINNFKKTSYNFVPMIDRNKSVSDVEDYYWLKSGGGGGYTGAEPVEEEVDFEDKIDDSELDPCTKEIMDKINQDTNNDIVKILEKFGTSEYNVKLQMGPTALNNYAETKVISKNNYSITVSNNSFSDATKLYRATGLLHEIVHAYMLSIVDDYKIYPTNAPFNGFPELFKLYVQKTGSGNTLAAQHEDMANKYVDAIASALEKYHLGNTSRPVSLADKQVFADLAWSGLDGTEIFNKKYPIGSEERKRITNRLVAETIGVYSSDAIGKPCN
ncbi:hypothetical protein FVB9288_03071 [Flavobacterium sp. CECT 9288]|uniref:hypothetical protein n=1 Tax=Flavobacterium sp. CECT 9288 TaxID=2845819 RepID=UPI001E3F314D|nr:hypothetical protein [Flavobacterium sp. CECT 9288]CAH0337316.1 hypothetical protein FVB9288_03071 [Flavobacterium sp. CECT 9288]